MIRSIQSNIDDRYRGEHPFTDDTVRSVIVFALGSADAIADPATKTRVTARAEELLGTPSIATAAHAFNPGDLAAGEPFEVTLLEEPGGHRVRAVDGPLDDEAVFAVRVIGRRSWT